MLYSVFIYCMVFIILFFSFQSFYSAVNLLKKSEFQATNHVKFQGIRIEFDNMPCDTRHIFPWKAQYIWFYFLFLTCLGEKKLNMNSKTIFVREVLIIKTFHWCYVQDCITISDRVKCNRVLHNFWNLKILLDRF